MVILVALMMWVQTFSPNAYTQPYQEDPAQEILAMDNGHYLIDMGHGCGEFTPGTEVIYLGGSGGVGTLLHADETGQCSIYIESKLNDAPCAFNTEGLCDVDWE